MHRTLVFQATQNLMSFVPNAILPYIEINNEQFGSETRRLTVMFMALGVDLETASSDEGTNRIQTIVTTI